MIAELPIDSLVSVGLLITNTILLLITCASLIITFFSMKHSRQQLLANDAPRILVMNKRLKFRKEYQSIIIDIKNIGNGVCLDVICLIHFPAQKDIGETFWMAKPSREILPLGEYSFYFLRTEKIAERLFLNRYAYEIKVVYKDFFGRLYQAGDNLANEDDSHLKQFADEGKQLKGEDKKSLERWMEKAFNQDHYYDKNVHIAMRLKGFDAKQRDNRYNKLSDSE